MERYDFAGWATKTGIRCSDGRTIMQDAFKDCDNIEVPLVWNHQQNSVDNILGHALLHNVDGGVYTYGYFNETPSGMNAKKLLQHGDIKALSIYANKLKQQGGSVYHGTIREVSLVPCGANPGATIEYVLKHGDIDDDAFVVITAEDEPFEIFHSENNEEYEEEPGMTEPTIDNTEELYEERPSLEDVIKNLDDEELTNLAEALAEAGYLDGEDYDDDEYENDDDEGEEDIVRQSAFYNNYTTGDYIQHGGMYDDDYYDEAPMMSYDEQEEFFHSAIDTFPTLSAAVAAYEAVHGEIIMHADNYGIRGIEDLVSQPRELNPTPGIINNRVAWVSKVINGTSKSPTSRVKSRFADIRPDEVRARGYVKGKYKKEQVFSLLKRATEPCTFYTKYRVDRDDILDITSFDALAMIKQVMELKSDEEKARAILIGDGRSVFDEDKIKEDCIRPIWTEEDLFCIHYVMEHEDDAAKETTSFIDNCIKAREEYEGSGNTTLFTTEGRLTEALLLKDGLGYKIYKTENEVAQACRCKDVETVQHMKGQSRTVDGVKRDLMGIIINMGDYTVGQDPRAIGFFDDFDINYNQQVYLKETRMSGALTQPYSAIVIEAVPKGTLSATA